MLAAQVRNLIGDRLDIFVSNAGISNAATFENMTVKDFDNLFAVNVRAARCLLAKRMSLARTNSLPAPRARPRIAAIDIRLMSCGPRAGFAELEIPENEPGSSIMQLWFIPFVPGPSRTCASEARLKFGPL
jgi:aspartate ammonia-lyase